jgi:4-hydroxybenzoate polyprenyltransferase
MKLLVAFLRLIRLLNLLFIAATQVLFKYAIVQPILKQMGVSSPLSTIQFFLLVLSSVLIAAAGYIINDYFDMNIDLINKPQKMVVEKHIRRRWAILWHMTLSMLGIAISFYLSWKTGAWWLGFANMGCVIGLWFYSTTFKKRMLSGNIIISLMTAWVVLVVGLLNLQLIAFKVNDAGVLFRYGTTGSKLLRLTFLYAGFAFIISVIREVIKDMEDLPGDERYGCRTMPIVWGVNSSKVFAATWMVVLIAALVIVQIYVLPFQWWWPALYCTLLIIAPMLYLLRKLYTAASPKDFHHISNGLKFVMLTGILSMIFFKLYL